MRQWYRNGWQATVVICLVILAAVALYKEGRSLWYPVYLKMGNKRTVESVVAEYAPLVEPTWQEKFVQAGVSYPPEALTLLAVKDEKRLEVWAKGAADWRFIEALPIVKASGVLGPKLREGDKQVPEGFYQIIGLNPNSAYHLSMKLNFPNTFDWARAKEEARTEPGSNIFIHGKASSIGCLAMGDEAIERLFILVSRVTEPVDVLIAPTDPRKAPLVVPHNAPAWTAGLYNQLAQAFQRFHSTF